MGKRAVGALVACALALGACSGSRRASGPDPATAGATTPTAPAAVPTNGAPRSSAPTTVSAPPGPAQPLAPAPEFSFDDSVPAPKVINTGHDYVAILESLSKYADWIAAHHPDADLMDGYIAPGSSRHADLVTLIAALRKKDAREVERRDGSNRYTIVSARPDAFSARVVEDVVLREIVDPRGRVLAIDRFSTPTTYVILAVLVSGHWELASVQDQQSTTVHL